MSIIDMSAVELVKRMKEKELSPVEVVKAFLDRIDEHNSKWNAFVTINDRALTEAKEAEEAIVKGKKLGKLHGLPVAIKDLTPTKGLRTTYGSPVFKDYIPDHEPTFLKRIKAAGGIVLGKTNTPEFGHKGVTDNPLFGVTKNPWDEKLTPGGSSGGSAVAVAAKLAPIAEGSDGGGSIRIPAAFTGVFGFKPTYGLIPHDSDPDNVFGSQSPFLHNGPMARTTRDAAMLFSVMQGYDANDPFSLPNTGEDFEAITGSVQGLKIAYTRDFGMYEVSEDVEKLTEQACSRLTSLGCEVEEVKVDYELTLKELSRSFVGMWCAKYASGYGDLYDQSPENFSENISKMIAIGRKLSAVDYKKIELNRTKVWQKTQALLNDYDLIISPTLATTAFAHHLPGPSEINGKKAGPNDWMMTQIYNMTGHPAASLPIGLTESGLPVGLQIAANRLADRLVLQLCQAYENAFETYIAPPIH